VKSVHASLLVKSIVTLCSALDAVPVVAPVVIVAPLVAPVPVVAAMLLLALELVFVLVSVVVPVTVELLSVLVLVLVPFTPLMLKSDATTESGTGLHAVIVMAAKLKQNVANLRRLDMYMADLSMQSQLGAAISSTSL
jgi:hypothetical protein